MRRLVAPMPFVLAALAAGCSRRAKPASALADASGPASGVLSVQAGARFTRSDPVYSAPIAATRVGPMSYVAGLVAAEGVVRL
jgi:hypothetical protein